jgi:acetyltransferase-like isoleucine patch superfamily enzyme
MKVAAYFMSLSRHALRMAVMRLKMELLRYRYPELVIGYKTIIRYDRLDVFDIGPDVSIGPFCEIVAIQQTSMSSLAGRLTIGSGTVVGAHANIRAVGGIVRIGQNGLIAQHVSILAANHDIKPGQIYSRIPYDEQRTGVRIGSNVWIGAGAVLLPGSSVGDNCIIAAGAVVTKDVPANEIWGGIPARQIATLTE